ncbi:MAG: hypothetical protein FJ265_08270 [Planctomycetes bacterium]|nr:hypothetical protein [Planctomycetota bacterium]
MNEASGEETAAATSMRERVHAACKELKEQAAAAVRAARMLAPLGKAGAYEDTRKLDKVLTKVQKGLGSLPAVPLATATMELVEAWRKARQETLRQQLGRELKAACDGAGLSLHTVSREPPVEVRISPLAVVIDFDRARAELRFAKEALGYCPADAKAILTAHAKVKAGLERGFAAETFFDQCLTAWRAARAATASSERVELLDFLPFLAVLRQPAKFRSAPVRENFASYPRAQFAFDVMRLRREFGLSRNGWRMNLGVATGTTASDKRRVLYLEDEAGNGEYKLTVFFTKEEAHP